VAQDAGKMGWGIKLCSGRVRNNNGSVCGGGSIERAREREREKGCGPRGKRAKVLRSDIAPLVFMCA
jgi:hypothetical protein